MAWITSIPVRKTRWKFTGKSSVTSRNAGGLARLARAIIRLISVRCCSYKQSHARTIITWFLIVVTGGLLRLVFHWVPHLMLLATHSRCSLEEAETVLLIESFQGKHTSRYVKRLRVLTAREVVLVIFT